MFISVFHGIQGDDYTVHKILQRNFQGERVLYQRRKTSTHVLSFRPPLKKNTVSKNVSPILNNLKVGDNIAEVLGGVEIVTKDNEVVEIRQRQMIEEEDEAPATPIITPGADR